MDYTGIINKYKTNRSLNDEERTLQLKQKELTDVEPREGGFVIKMNKICLEVVDKLYGFKGIAFLFTASIFIGLLIFIGLMLDVKINRWPNLSDEKKAESIWVYLVMGVILLPLIGFCIWAVSKEAFNYTHKPVRLNRKNRMVYVFRHNGPGGVLTVPWDDVFFCIGRCSKTAGVVNWEIRGHVLDADGVTVRDTFAMSYYVTEHNLVKDQWEYIRRYMEDGPQTIPPVEEYLDIDGKRETPFNGFRMLMSNVAVSNIVVVIVFPFVLLVAISRYICMITSRVPRWPQAVKDACGD